MLDQFLEPQTTIQRVILSFLNDPNLTTNVGQIVDLMTESERNYVEGSHILFQRIRDLNHVSVMERAFELLTYIVSQASRTELYGRQLPQTDSGLSLTELVDRTIVRLLEFTPFLSSFRTLHNVPQSTRDAALHLLALVQQHSRVLQQQREQAPVVFAGESTDGQARAPPSTAPPLPRGPPPSLKRHSVSAPVNMESVAAAVANVEGRYGNAVLVEGDAFDVVVLDSSRKTTGTRAPKDKYRTLQDEDV